MVKVRLEGLKIARARGKYYVYVRSTGHALLRGFEGSREALRKRLAQPDMIGAYNVRRKKREYPEQSLGWLVEWYLRSSEFKALSKTTQEEYSDRLKYLEPEYDFPLADLTTADIYEVRDRCVREKWPAFADKMVTALSSMFALALPRGWMKINPALGIKRASKTDPHANREWRPEEWETVMARAPEHLRTAYMIARHVGYRSQSIVAVSWENYQKDRRFGMCFRMNHKKNAEKHWLPASPELQAYLAAIKPKNATGPIALRKGKPWGTPYKLQKASSNFLRKLAADGLVGPGLTEHGLRVTFAAEIKRLTGANDDQVAAALGDRDTRMGAHYTRHVEQENKIIFLWAQRLRTKEDLENGAKDVFQIEKNGIVSNDLDE
ncbi:MAG: tyrosine-type recombinase/integrase [Bradyrhizobium sp.]|uniref:tyrosine-type recombinase/integrase n=1 Tax=Bradyrhizobium sp. TaxID=376 RepID=UPI003BF1B472